MYKDDPFIYWGIYSSGVTPYNGLYGNALSERGTYFRPRYGKWDPFLKFSMMMVVVVVVILTKEAEDMPKEESNLTFVIKRFSC